MQPASGRYFVSDNYLSHEKETVTKRHYGGTILLAKAVIFRSKPTFVFTIVVCGKKTLSGLRLGRFKECNPYP